MTWKVRLWTVVVFICLSILWIFVKNFSFRFITIILGTVVVFVLFVDFFYRLSTIEELGDEKLIILRKFGGKSTIPYSEVIACNVLYHPNGTELELTYIDDKNKRITRRYLFWLAGEAFLTTINYLSEKFDIFAYSGFMYAKKRKWRPIKPKSTWVPYEQRKTRKQD